MTGERWSFPSLSPAADSDQRASACILAGCYGYRGRAEFHKRRATSLSIHSPTQRSTRRIQRCWVTSPAIAGLRLCGLQVTRGAARPRCGFSLGDDGARNLFIKRIVDLGDPNSTTHLIILTGDLGPTDEEVLVECGREGSFRRTCSRRILRAADRALIRSEWFGPATLAALAKYPPYFPPPWPTQPSHPQQQQRPGHQETRG